MIGAAIIRDGGKRTMTLLQKACLGAIAASFLSTTALADPKLAKASSGDENDNVGWVLNTKLTPSK